jgi:phosphoglycerate kinase
MALDIGQDTISHFKKIIATAGTIFWNGPSGVFEFKNFQFGTKSICQLLKDATAHGVFTVIGGGDSASAAVSLGFNEKDFSFISTGGGAALEFIEGAALPGIIAIQDR